MNRSDIAKKISKLAAMTVERGCSENEAQMALKAIEELMAKLSTPIISGATKVIQYKLGKSAGTIHHVQYVLMPLARLFGVRMWRNRTCDVVIFGLADDVDAAREMIIMIREAMDCGYDHYQAMHAKSLQARKTYMTGFAARIGERVNEIYKNRMKNVTFSNMMHEKDIHLSLAVQHQFAVPGDFGTKIDEREFLSSNKTAYHEGFKSASSLRLE